MNGRVIALIPIRSLSGGKTRLASVLSPVARAALTRRMLRTVAGAALDSGSIGSVVVVSPDEAALDFAASLDARIVPLAQSADEPGLNPAIGRGIAFAVERKAAAALILFGDLPLLTPDDVRNLLRRDAPVVIAPDRHGTGTNALALRLDGFADARRFTFHFGPGSYSHHIDEAHHHGLDVVTSLTAGTAFDLDTPEDLRRALTKAEVSLDFAEDVLSPADAALRAELEAVIAPRVSA